MFFIKVKQVQEMKTQEGLGRLVSDCIGVYVIMHLNEYVDGISNT
jgi:hypothetical protein